MKKIELLKIVKNHVINNFNGEDIELYDFLYENIDYIAKEADAEIDQLEEILIDKNSSMYRRLVNLIVKSNNLSITIKEVSGLYYVIKNNRNNDIKETYEKIEFILNNIEDNSKGYIFQEFVLLYLEDIGIKIIERKKVDDGGLDIVGYKTIEIFNGIEQMIYIYGQVKFYKDLVSTCYLKQLIKDRLYRVIKEKNTFTETDIAIFISHKGGSINTKEYAKENNITLIDTTQIIRDVLSINEKAKCLEYINKEYQKVFKKII